jgi:hypothetical protein
MIFKHNGFRPNDIFVEARFLQTIEWITSTKKISSTINNLAKWQVYDMQFGQMPLGKMKYSFTKGHWLDESMPNDTALMGLILSSVLAKLQIDAFDFFVKF